MKAKTLMVGVVVTVVSAVGLGGVASAATPGSSPAVVNQQEQPQPTAEQCQKAGQRLQERQANLQTRIERLESWLAKAQEAGRTEAVEKIQRRIQKLQDRLAKANERLDKLNRVCAQS